MTPSPKPVFATNRPDRDQTVAGAIRGHLDHLLATWQQPPAIDIASAYFNPAGFELIADQLEQVGEVRLLLGAEPEPETAGPRRLSQAALPAQAHRAALRAALAGHQRTVEQDRDLLGFEPNVDAATRRLIAWLRSGRVQVRRYTEGFLHGKAFLVASNMEGVLAGSANFTRAGLAFNRELMLGHYDPPTVTQVHDWFQELWDDAEDYDLTNVYEKRYAEHQPHAIYLRMLYERYGQEVQEEAAADGVGMHLTAFQRDGVWRARRVLDAYHGVVIADGVGLGKTYVAGALIREYVEQRRQRVLIVAPAALRDGPWEGFLTRHDLPRSVQCISFEQLSGDPRLGGTGSHVLKFDPADYGLIVIDEAHGYRNPDTLRADALRRLLEGSPPKDVVMLTATPVNNSLFDLYHLLAYFVRNDAAFAHAGIRSLREHFAEATAQDPEDLAPDRLFDVLDAVAVRRTRRFIKTYYPHDRVKDNRGNDVPISFPAVQVLRVVYDLEQVVPGLFVRLAYALAYEPGQDAPELPKLEDPPTLTLARYSPSRYRNDGQADAYQLQIAGLLRAGLLKRFESSSKAFANTCRTMAGSNDKFLALLAEGRVATGAALTDWSAPEGDQIVELSETLLEASEPAAAYDLDALRADVLADRELLLEFASEAETVAPDIDPKLAALVEELAVIAAQADTAVLPEERRDARKVIVFTYYTDTVQWIAEHLATAIATDPRLSAYRNRMVTIDGSGSEDKSTVLYGFAPISTEAPEGRNADLHDLLISTDVLAEGVNLQQAANIINYDLPWNPMRLVQRHGRIDRIGSKHLRVVVRCFFPDRQLDDILRLEQRLKRKLHAAAAAVGVESEVLPGSKVSEIVFSETRDEIERLRAGDATLLERGGEHGHAYSGEEYRQEVRAALANPLLEQALLGLPWGSGSGLERVGADPGFVFCARVGDHPHAIFRYVSMADLGQPEIVGDTLACLAHAHARETTLRSLSEETLGLAYRAWEAARHDVFDEWQQATDLRNLSPRVPKVLRQAAALLRDHPPEHLDQGELGRLIDAVEAPYPPRIQGAIRQALSGDDPNDQRAARVATEITRLGLQPASPPQPLPFISIEDVHLVCWQAITPALGHVPEDE